MTSSPIDPAIASAFEEETPFHTPNVLLNTVSVGMSEPEGI